MGRGGELLFVEDVYDVFFFLWISASRKCHDSLATSNKDGARCNGRIPLNVHNGLCSTKITFTCLSVCSLLFDCFQSKSARR